MEQLDEETTPSSRTTRFAEWLLSREEAKESQEIDRSYRMLRLNTFLTLAILCVVGGQDSTDLVMSLIWFI